MSLAHLARGNRILASLAPDDFERLRPHLERVQFAQNQILYNVGDPIKFVYFPVCGMISLLSTTEDGETVKLAMVGNEGVAGVSVALTIPIAPYQMLVEIPVEALRIDAQALKTELLLGGKLQDLMMKYIHQILILISQASVCNRFHTVERRLSSCLLTASDCVKSNSLSFTQDTLSRMLGTPRPVVSTAAGILQDLGLIRYRRGKITILDPGGLETTSCECYKVVQNVGSVPLNA